MAGSALAYPASQAAVGNVEALYRENHAFVWRNARRLGAQEDWVDDAVHEVFLVATRRLHEFEGRSSVKTWLFAITFRVVQRLQRDKFRQQRHTARYVREQPPAVVDAASETERAEYLRYLLALLPNPQRAIARRCASWCAAARARIRFWRAPLRGSIRAPPCWAGCCAPAPRSSPRCRRQRSIFPK